MGRLLIERLTKELNLTPDQQSKLEMVLRSSRQEFQEISEKMKPEEARIRIQGLLRQKIGGILTDEQKQKLKEQSQSSQAEQGKPARVWILSPAEKPTPLSVVLGITDGTFSEVILGICEKGRGSSSRRKKGPSRVIPPFTETSTKKSQSSSSLRLSGGWAGRRIRILTDCNSRSKNLGSGTAI